MHYTNHCGTSAVLDPETGLVAPLTPCCGATATGTTDGTACRACYEIVSPLYGTSGWTALVQAAEDKHCPCPTECATYILYVLENGLAQEEWV